MKTINAVKITGSTLVGSSGKFPRLGGNCFSFEDDLNRLSTKNNMLKAIELAKAGKL